MANYKSFEDVPVWRDGAELCAALFALTEDRSFRGKGDIANQLQRAGLSVPNNIAEGFERGTTEEVITFLYYARGSAGEVRSILCVMELIPAFDHLKSQITNLKSRAASVSRQLRAWAGSLQDSDIRGQRHLTSAGRTRFEQQRRAEAFLQRLAQETDGNRARLEKEPRQEVGDETM
jgi:four helix bundle protein